MKTVIQRAAERGHSHMDWLKSDHSFSFADYYDPDHMGFGALRVLNDDRIDGGSGFPPHPHRNMEIISIPLSGGLKHEDSTGQKHVIQAGDIQVMSAGSGIVHSEYNAYEDRETNFLQIWIIPNEKATTPRYQQQTYETDDFRGAFKLFASPQGQPGLDLRQNAFMSRALVPAGEEIEYVNHISGHGQWLFVIEGSIQVLQNELNTRDALAVTGTHATHITTRSDSDLLVIEVPV